MENTTEFFLRENVLTDNVLLIADKGYLFTNGIKAIIKEYYYQSPWNDKEEIKKFKSLNSLNKYLNKFYPEIDYIDFIGTSLEENK